MFHTSSIDLTRLLKRPDTFYIPNSLSIQRVKSREGPPVNFVVWTGNSSRVFQDKKQALKFIQWPKSTPTGQLIREWFDQFDEDGTLPELDMEKIRKEGFGPEAHLDGEDPTAQTKMVV